MWKKNSEKKTEKTAIRAFSKVWFNNMQYFASLKDYILLIHFSFV
jgi:hypothetical protein